jgi:glycosyltransferase involved in cell wall biosynthesis
MSDRSDLDLVCWLPAINPYWARRFSALQHSGLVRFHCWFNSSRGAGRQWIVRPEDMDFPHTFLSGQAGRRYLQVARLYRRQSPRRVLTFHFDPRLWPSLLHVGFRRELAFYVEMTWDSWVERRWFKEVLKSLLFNTAGTVFVPGRDAAEYVARYRQAGRPVVGLPHVVDLDLLRTARHIRRDDGRLRVLYLGRFIEEKGLRDLTSAVELLEAEGLDFTVSFVGSGPLESDLSNWARQRRVPVQVGSFVQAEDLVPVLASNDVLVFPTLGDPYGLVVSEALAAGMGVVSSSSAGEVRDRLVDGPLGPRGIVVPPANPDELCRAIARLASDRPALAMMQSNAAAYADAHLDTELWVEAVERWVGDVHARAAKEGLT